MLNERNISIAEAPVRPRQLRQLMERIVDGTISGKIAKEVDETMWTDGGSPDEIIEKKGLKQISDSGAVEKIVDEVMAAGAKLVADYRSGKEKAFNALVGQVMKASKGKANPAQVNEILRRKLKG
jgi:aspartyl-tRNA(Asn)/glutamyl-tRNA(Gln) amidotransferase subunit B